MRVFTFRCHLRTRPRLLPSYMVLSRRRPARLHWLSTPLAVDPFFILRRVAHSRLPPLCSHCSSCFVNWPFLILLITPRPPQSSVFLSFQFFLIGDDCFKLHRISLSLFLIVSFGVLLHRTLILRILRLLP